MSNKSLTTKIQFISLVVSLPVLWILVFLSAYFLMTLGALALAFGPVDETIYPSLLNMAMIIASVAMILCFYKEMREGGLQNPITAFKNIGKFTLASVALPILWFGATVVVAVVLVVPSALIGFVDIATAESEPKNLQLLVSLSAIVGGMLTTAGIVYQWKHKKKDLFMAVLGSVMILMSVFMS